jgi:hypothetical protein
MPKIGKKAEEEVIKHLKNGYSIKETSEITGRSRSYVTNINKKIKRIEDETHIEAFNRNQISDESLRILYNIQGIYGKKVLMKR